MDETRTGFARPETDSEHLRTQAGPTESGDGGVPLGERVRAFRRARGWTQDQLAQATGVSRSAVAQWETGRAGFTGKLRAIAEALEIPARQLQTGTAVEIPRRFGESVPISEQEVTLLRHFRELDSNDQACLLRVAQKLATAFAA